MIDLHPLCRALLFLRCVPSVSCGNHEHRILIHHGTRLQCDVGQAAGLKECPAQLCELLNWAQQPAFPPHPTSLSASQDLLLLAVFYHLQTLMTISILAFWVLSPVVSHQFHPVSCHLHTDRFLPSQTNHQVLLADTINNIHCTHKFSLQPKVSQSVPGCVTHHTRHASVTHFRPILGNIVEVTLVTSPKHVYNSHTKETYFLS